ncbi:motility associated factor glycosyltransferase family protein, partial [bacterium]|nr:motility associated factor glycosyltransferase family protein [bacterium]
MELYKKNIEALKEVNPDLAKYIDNCKKPDWISDVKSENKSLNFVVKDGSKQTTGHDPKNPEKEVLGLIKKVKYYKDNSAVIVGMGYGYLPIAILKKAENSHKLIVVEPEPYFVKKSFELHDFSKYLLNNDFFIATPTKLEVDIIVNMINSAKVVSNWMVMISSYIALKKDVYHEISEHTAKMLNQLHCNTGTVSGAGKQIAQNDIESLPFIIKHRGVKDLYGLYKGKPAVIVSTGPSSWKNIYQLKEIQDKVIIICVAQALRMLLAYGIKPDFACTVDFGEVNESHFDGIMDCGIPLVALNRTYAPILQKYEGQKFIVGTVPADGFENSSSAVIQRKGSLEQGGSVAHLALGLAYALGCDNIALTGQDLSYP